MERLDHNSIETIRTWLSNRGANETFDLLVCDSKYNLNMPDLYLEEYNKDMMARPNMSKMAKLDQLMECLGEFARQLREHRQELETLEQISNGFQRQLAKFHVQEALNLMSSCLCLDEFVDIKLNRQDCVYLRGKSQWTCDEIICQVLLRLFSLSSVDLIADTDLYGNCLLVAYLVDLMHMSGLPKDQVRLYAREGTSSGRQSVGEPTRLSHLSPPATPDTIVNTTQQTTTTTTNSQVVYICLANVVSIQVASSCILDSYLRDLNNNQNAIVLIEESIYNLFVEFWRQNYSKLLKENDDLKLLSISVDLNSIDIGVARKCQGSCINMIKFRSLDELNKLISSLRKISYVQLWTRDDSLARELCMSRGNNNNNRFSSSMRRCPEFWLNHLPATLSGRKFPHTLLDHCRDTLRGDQMNEHYSDLSYQFGHQIEQLKRQQLVFVRKYSHLKRGHLIMDSYLKLISKFKSMKQMGISVEDAYAKMKRFHQQVSRCYYDWPTDETSAHESIIEHNLKPTGLAILSLRGKNNVVKSKSVIIEFVYKNLLIGNAVLVVLTENLLGLRFPANLLSARKLPFELIDLSKSLSPQLDESLYGPVGQSTPTLQVAGQSHVSFTSTACNSTSSSRLSSCWSDTPDSGVNTSLQPIDESPRPRKPLKCPSGVYVIQFGEFREELTSELVDLFVVSLGCRRRSLWLPGEPSNGSANFATGQQDEQHESSGCEV